MDKRNEGSWDLRSMQWSWQTREVRRHRSDGRTSAVYWRNKTFLFSTNPLFYDFAFNAGNDRSITKASTLRYIQKSFISSQNGLDLIGRYFRFFDVWFHTSNGHWRSPWDSCRDLLLWKRNRSGEAACWFKGGIWEVCFCISGRKMDSLTLPNWSLWECKWYKPIYSSSPKAL